MSNHASEVIVLKEKLDNSLESHVIAFLNTLGGTIYLGVKDDGTICGIDDVDEVILQVSDKIRNNILPFMIGLSTIKVIEEEGKKIIAISVAGGLEKPYYLRKYGLSSKGCFVRSGTQTFPMLRSQIESLFSRRVINTLHNVVSPNQYLTFSQLKIYYQEKGFMVDNDYFLKNLGLYTEDGKYNYVAYLMADNNGNSIKVARFKGIDKSEILERNEYGRCCLIKSTLAVLDKLDVINTTAVRVKGKASREEYRLVNHEALREAVINAIIHNDYINGAYPVFEIYDDRIEVVSSGGLPNGLSVEEFFNGRSLPRNRELMRIFSDMSFCEQLGSGIKKIMKYCNKEDFDISEHFLAVKFKYNKKALSILETENGDINGDIKLKERVLDLIANDPSISRNDISRIINISTRTVDRIIKELKDGGLIIGKTKNKNGKWILKVDST